MQTNSSANGYIKLHRKILDWEWFDDANAFRLFITILLMANWKSKKWRGRTIPRGSLWTTIDTLATKTGLTYQQTRTALFKLKSTGEITDEVTNAGRLITVVNYEVYQDDAEKITDESTDERTGKQQTNNRRSNRQANKRVTTTEEHIRNKEHNNIKQQQFGRRFETIDLNEVLSVEEIAALANKYENINELLSEVEADINAKEKRVRYPVRYIEGYARNTGWPVKQ